MRSIIRVVEVLPLVPVTWITGKACCGSPNSSITAAMRWSDGSRSCSGARMRIDCSISRTVCEFLACAPHRAWLRPGVHSSLLLGVELELHPDAFRDGVAAGLTADFDKPLTPVEGLCQGVALEVGNPDLLVHTRGRSHDRLHQRRADSLALILRKHIELPQDQVVLVRTDNRDTDHGAINFGDGDPSGPDSRNGGVLGPPLSQAHRHVVLTGDRSIGHRPGATPHVQNGHEVVPVGHSDDDLHQIFFTRMRIDLLSPTTTSTPWSSDRACVVPAEPNCTDSVSSMISFSCATVTAQTSSSPLTVRLIRSLTSRPASRRAVQQARMTSRANPSAASSGVTVVFRTTNPLCDNMAVTRDDCLL